MKNKHYFLFSSLLTMFLMSCSSQRLNSEESGNADDLLVVDCLLPGQVRQLGRLATFLMARQAIKTTAVDCAIRGGEFVPPSKATYRTALDTWMPRAETGDPEAQAYVGEIYEKGYGREPDYEMAAVWYKKAAKQGNVRAQVNLGYLYEKGLGVKPDKEEAVKWYAESAQQKDVPYASTISTFANEQKYTYEIKLLKAELKNSEAERARLTENLKSTREQLQTSNQNIRELQTVIENIKNRINQQDGTEQNDLKRQLQEKQSILNNEKSKIQQLEQQYNDEVSVLTASLSNTEKRAEQFANELRKEKNQANKLQIKLLVTESYLAKTENELLQQKALFQNKISELSVEKSHFKKLNEDSNDSTKQVTAELELQVAEQRNKISLLEQEKKAFQQRLNQLQSDVSKQTVFEKPVIEIIDPSFVYTRGVATVRLRSLVKERELIGKVNSPGGLLSLLINDRKSSVDENGLFRTNMQLVSKNMPVEIVAVDKQGQKSSLNFVFSYDPSSSSEETQLAKLSSNPWKGLNFGNYHALIIGNNNYQKVPSLDTPHADAKEVADVLKRKYGFNTRLLMDATRYQILSALNKLRAELTENDNLLVYYAGHGELDQVNMRGHWLPVDADADNTANWISTVAITDIFNAMSSKHILVVSDSCYSGAMTRSSLARLPAGMGDAKQKDWIKAMIKTKSRTVLTSGGLEPVMDGGGGKHSIFAQAFISALKNNNSLLEGQSLYRIISSGIVSSASRYGIEQVPEYAPIRHAGHEAGEFFFMPNS